MEMLTAPSSTTSTSSTRELIEKYKDKFKKKLWRIQNLYKIRDKNRKIVPLHLNAVQRRIVNQIAPTLNARLPVRHFDLKSRQQGISTFWLIWWFDDTLWRANTVTGVLAHKRESLNYLMNIPRIAYDYLPGIIKPKLVEDTKWGMKFDYNSQFFVSLSIRSTGVHNLHISEWCWCEDEEVQASIGAASELTNITGETTGNGVGNDGYVTYQQAKIGENGFTQAFHPWYFSPEYVSPLNGLILKQTDKEKALRARVQMEYGIALTDEQLLWRRLMDAKLKSIRKQEYPESDDDAFRTSGNKFFDYKKAHTLIMEAKEFLRTNEPIEQTDDYIQFEVPKSGSIYVAGADTSEGVGDYSVLKIINVTEQRDAFVYRARCGVDVFYKVCDKWCRKFNNALLAVERNNHGHAVLLGLENDCRYPRLYRTTTTKRLKVDEIPIYKTGWETNATSRPIMLDELKWAIEGDSDQDEEHFEPEFTVLDIQLLKELLTFTEKDGKFEAEAGEHDDDIIATSIAYQVYKRNKRYTRFQNLPSGNGHDNGKKGGITFGILVGGTEREEKI